MKLALAIVMLAQAQEAPRPDTFDRCLQRIRPRPGESLWADVPWLTDLHEARRKAAAEGKPLFVQAGGKSASIGAC